ncbi:hypothetical protein ETB97_001722 [Aspergillus alliaceus]|uniref:Enoyl reductase (ER) domain-containing protein n=1 Tax=Petromyces alliaceus TaxID=209559 RepID=A0A8H6A2E1_PETAA|nr:hypothetical protein ETB97_001722 [Aspergillus burnettii]
MTMKQWVVENKDNDFDELAYKDAAVPKVGEREVLVKLYAASLNYRDLGKYPFPAKFPVVPASDGSGEVVEVGPKVTEFKKGDHVVTLFNQGNYETGLVKAAKNHNAFENSTHTCAALTSWNALYGLKPLKPGQVALVQGTGGVSMFGLQFAKAAGATVIATTSSAAKAEKLKKLGADYIINYKDDTNWGESARKLTPEGAGVDHIIKVGGLGTLTQSFKAINNIYTVRGVYMDSKELIKDIIRTIKANDIYSVLDKKVFTLN